MPGSSVPISSPEYEEDSSVSFELNLRLKIAGLEDGTLPSIRRNPRTRLVTALFMFGQADTLQIQPLETDHFDEESLVVFCTCTTTGGKYEFVLVNKN